MNELLEHLQNHLTQHEAKKLVSLIKNCDNYLNKFKKEITPYLDKLDKQVLVGIRFKEKE